MLNFKFTIDIKAAQSVSVATVLSKRKLHKRNNSLNICTSYTFAEFCQSTFCFEPCTKVQNSHQMQHSFPPFARAWIFVKRNGVCFLHGTALPFMQLRTMFVKWGLVSKRGEVAFIIQAILKKFISWRFVYLSENWCRKTKCQDQPICLPVMCHRRGRRFISPGRSR